MVSMQNIEPLNATVFIELDKIEEKKHGSIIISTTNNTADMDTGVIAEMGPAAFADELHTHVNLKPGDRVVFNRYAGKEIKDVAGNVTHRIMADVEIWGRIREDRSTEEC